MKIKTSFVSNSSSSSFICQICDEAYEGWGGYGEIIEYTCDNSHAICSKCFTSDIISMQTWRDYYENHKDDGWWDEEAKEEILEALEEEDTGTLLELLVENGDIPPEFCPCCNFEYVADDDILKYLFKITGLDYNTTKEQIKKKFKNYDEFNNM